MEYPMGGGESGICALSQIWPIKCKIPVSATRLPSAVQRTSKFVLYVLALLLISATVLSAEPCMYDVDDGGSVGIELETMYDSLPEKGFLPVTMHLDNRTGSEQKITITAESSGESIPVSRLSHSITIPARSSSELSLTVPLEENWSVTGGSLVVRYDLQGIKLRRRDRDVTIGSRNSDPCVHRFEVNKNRKLALYSSGANVRFPESTLLRERRGFMLQTIPDSWYQLIGVTEIWLTEEEAGSLPLEKQETLLDWVRSGGTLYAIQPVRESENSIWVGLGRVVTTSRSPDVQSEAPEKSGLKAGGLEVQSPSGVSPLDRMQKVRGPIRILLFVYSIVLMLLVAASWYFKIRPALILFVVVPFTGFLTFTGGLALIISHSSQGRSGNYETLQILAGDGEVLTRTSASVDSGLVLQEFLESKAPAVLYHGETVLEGERNRAALNRSTNRITHLESRHVVIEEFLKSDLKGGLSSDGHMLTSTFSGELRDLRWIDDSGNCHQYERLKEAALISEGKPCTRDIIATVFFRGIHLKKGQFFATMETEFQPTYGGVFWSKGNTYVVGSTREMIYE